MVLLQEFLHLLLPKCVTATGHPKSGFAMVPTQLLPTHRTSPHQTPCFGAAWPCRSTANAALALALIGAVIGAQLVPMCCCELL